MISDYMKSVVLSVLFSGMSSSALYAATLTPKEKTVCSSLRVCVDIIRRHDASEFDYAVLETEFERFGASGRDALFDLLETKAGNADIAQMISYLGALSADERVRIQRNWTENQADTYLPLLLDGHPSSRDLLLRTLASDQVSVRERARPAIAAFPETIERQPVTEKLQSPILAALQKDPMAEVAPYLARLNANRDQDSFAALLLSGDNAIVSASYEALYRANPSQAFSRLLSEMGRAKSSEQSQAIGEMLIKRHAKRSDGFYLKFARDISGDQTRPIPARASGLHAVLMAGDGKLPDLTPARVEALYFLIGGQPFATQDKYLPKLKRAKSTHELAAIWTVAQNEKWINRDRISDFLIGANLGEVENQVITDLLQSDDLRTFRAGVKHAKPQYKKLLQAASHHPVQKISDLAHKALGGSNRKTARRNCHFANFDAKDGLTQMPFFDSAWTVTPNNARIVLDRKFLTTAHTHKSGWLAGYDLDHQYFKSALTGGALVSFDNKSGDFDQIGKFSGPVSILPHRPLKLGETTQRFWVIDQWASELGEMSAYIVDLSAGNSTIQHFGVLPEEASRFSVAPTGDLLIGFKGKTQTPLRLSQRGQMSFVCSPRAPINTTFAPN